MKASTDPAAPRFSADEPRVAATPFGRLDDEHPLRRALGRVELPASTERVLAVVSSHPDVDVEQIRWLDSVLPANAEFATRDEIVDAVGMWGARPPTAARGL